jgi:DNA-binding NtrC family response regulator
MLESGHISWGHESMTSHASHILILEDDEDVAYAARLSLRRCAERMTVLSHPGQLADFLKNSHPDLVLLDLNFAPGLTDGAEGLQVLKQLCTLPNPPAVIVMTAYADVPLAVESMKRGACDFITKPWENARLVTVVEGALARRTGLSQATGGSANEAMGELMGQSQVMRGLRSFIAKIAPTDANIMVLGENGVGKELVARAIHQASRRAAGNFLSVDMGSLPETTLESELFGHRKGAFTDARQDRSGRFQAASGGTLFLDEIGNLPLASQAKLLTALERREVTPLGADRPQAFDVRIVSATNLDESKLYDASVFRTDLLFRLNTIVMRVPPLRERAEDIPLLLNHYLAHYQQQYEKRAASLTAEALTALQAHAWPGNVRALRHACERAVIIAQSDVYTLADFGLPETGALPVQQSVPGEMPLQLDTLERDAVNAAMQQVQGNISRAAKLLGISRAALYRKLEKHAL